VCFSSVLGASSAPKVFKAGKASGTIFDGSQPKKSPKECQVAISTSEGGWLITVSTDQPFRANSEVALVSGVGIGFKAISFEIPSGSDSGAGSTKDDRGYSVQRTVEAAGKKGEQGTLTKLVVKFDGEDSGILKDTAEITLTPEFVPLEVRVESLTKTPSFNRKAKLTCEGFAEVEVEGVPTAASIEQSEQAARAPQEKFWQSLRELCGKAFAHAQDTPLPTTPILDVRKCDDESVLFGVHYLADVQEQRWNRAQTWLVSKVPDGLRMKYVRRDSSEPDAKQVGWSAATKEAGTANLQVFFPDEATVASSPTLKNFGWVIRIQPGDTGIPTLLYQAIEKMDEGEQSRGGYAFDLSVPIAPPDEPPWGMTAETPSEPAAPEKPAVEPPPEPAAEKP
jgi:hypothetical protein